MLTLCTSGRDRDSSVAPERKQNTVASAGKMLKIHSLLNPSTTDRSDTESVDPPPTPAYTVQSSTPASTPQPGTPDTATLNKRQKVIKDDAVFTPGAVKGSVNYPPYECTEDTVCLSDADQEELARQHNRFKIFPSGRGDEPSIGDFTRYIPYSSEKKSFFSKTKREGFEGKLIAAMSSCSETDNH